MSVMTSLVAAALLLQTPPGPQRFTLEEVTVTDIKRINEINDLRIASHLRLVVQSSAGVSSVIYMAALDSNPVEMGIWKSDVCRFEGGERLWVGDRPFSQQATLPQSDELILEVDEFQCREGADGRPDEEALVVLPTPLPTMPPVRSTPVTIVGVGISPRTPSGVLHTTTLILGQSDDGNIDPYYMTFHGDRMPVPPLGSRCVLHHRATDVYRGGSILVGGLSISPWSTSEVFWEFECAPPPSDEEIMRMNARQ